MYFLGTFDYAMDERGRVPLPPRHREAFRSGIVLSQGSPDRCIRLYTLDQFQAQSAKVTSLSTMSLKGLDLRRMFFSKTYDTQLDPQSRVLVPSWMRDYANLSGKVYLVGAGEWLEIWAPDAFDADIQRIEGSLGAMMESIEERR